jgi:hypothetical protein
MTGAGTQVLLPDGFVISFGAVSDYSVSGAAITFTNTTGVTHVYTAPSDPYAQLVMAALGRIPEKSSSFYIITNLIPTFAVTSIDTITGPAAGGTAVVVTGIGFVDGLVANLGGAAVASVLFISETSFSFVTPAGVAVGAGAPVNLMVRNPDGTETTFPNAYTYT